MRFYLFLLALLSAFPSFAAPRCDVHAPVQQAELKQVSLAYQSV